MISDIKQSIKEHQDAKINNKKNSSTQTTSPLVINDTSQTTPAKNQLSSNNAYTPTVILNEIAMRNNLLVDYETVSKTPISNNQARQFFSDNPKEKDFALLPLTNQHRQSTGKKYKVSCLFTVSVELPGKHIFYGQDLTQQKARHHAASQAIEFLNTNLDVLENPTMESQTSNEINNFPKSSITDLYCATMPRNLSVAFNIVQEIGPPHLKQYVMEVVVGTLKEGSIDQVGKCYKCQSTGKSKKEAKQNAATEVLELMKDLPPIIKLTKIRSKNKTTTSEPKENLKNEPMHPVSRLSQIMQAKQETEPVYTSVEEKNVKEGKYHFTVKCSAGKSDALGSGKSKKEAKKEAAHAMLKKLELLPCQQIIVPNKTMQPKKSILKVSKDDKKHKVKFFDDDEFPKDDKQFIKSKN